MKQLSHDLYTQNKDREFNAVENIAHAVNKVTGKSKKDESLQLNRLEK
jgi:hypothetical protein